MNRLRKSVLAGLALSAAAALALGWTTSAFAINGCRSDPTVYLSNGYSVQMWDQIGTDISNVSGVYYTLHVPKGVTVENIAYDSTGYLEHVQVYADQKPGQYYETSNVSAASPSTGFTAEAIRRDGTTASANGKTPDSVTMHWCT
ncbi:MAG TPA: hypothetical protein VFB34_03185 [Chloroflexota bacterium]|nr:hypothetical protein [Chloroflexota bacterium]